MAITRVWQSGFEHNEISVSSYGYEFDSRELIGSPINVSTQPGGVGGAYFLNIDQTNDKTVSFYTHFASMLQGRVGFHFRTTGGLDGGTIMKIFELKTLGGTRLYQIAYQPGTSQIHLYKNGSLAGTSSILFTINSWGHIVLDFKFDATNGWADLWVNGNLGYSFGLGNNGAVGAEAAGLGAIQTAPFARALNCDWDNFYIDNMAGEARGQAPPIYYYKALLPNADGNYSNWVGSDGNRTNNYLLVDEVPPNEDTDYVFASGTAIKDSYGVGAYTPTVGTLISSIIPTAIARKTGSENVLLGLGTRLGGVDVISTGTSVPATSYSSKFFFERQTTKPGGGVWESADVDGVEIIVESGGTYA